MKDVFPICVFHGKILPGDVLLATKGYFDYSRQLLQLSHNTRQAIRETENTIKSLSKRVNFFEIISPLQGIDSEMVNQSISEMKKGIQEGKKNIEASLLFLRKIPAGREKITQIFINHFLTEENLSSFYDRIEKIWTRFVAEKDESFSASEFLIKNPSHIIINKAIEEEFVFLFVETMLTYTSVYQLGDETDLEIDKKTHLENIRKIYRWLPRKYQYNIEMHGLYKSGDVEKLLDSEAPNLERLENALIAYCKDLSDPEPHLDSLCDETNKGLFFKATDHNGIIRAYVLGSYHSLPTTALRFRQKIRQAYHLATSVLVERNLRRFSSFNSCHQFHAELEKDLQTEKYYGFMDGLFLYEGLERDKWVIGLEDAEETKNGNPLTKFVQREDVHASVEDDQDQLDEAVIQIMREGDLTKLNEQIIPLTIGRHIRSEYQAEAIDKLLKHRNNVQCKETVNFLEEHPAELAFIVLGMGHLADFKDVQSYLSLLRMKGYSIEQIP